ncbi:MAG: hypothetical protein U1F57_10620 [bacterium]
MGPKSTLSLLPESQSQAFQQNSETVLTRSAANSSSAPELSSAQKQVDDMMSRFVHEATEWKSLAAMMAGGLAYRAGKLGVLAGSEKLLGAAFVRVAPVVEGVSALGGLATEVTAFEGTQRGLTALTEEGRQNPNLFKWEGKGGFKQGWLSSFVNFGALKSFGYLAEGQNVLLQHAMQDTGMVLGHHLAYGAGLGERPEGSLAEQLLHAEIVNLQMGAGNAMAHFLTNGVGSALEREMTFSFFTSSRFRTSSAMKEHVEKNGNLSRPTPFLFRKKMAAFGAALFLTLGHADAEAALPGSHATNENSEALALAALSLGILGMAAFRRQDASKLYRRLNPETQTRFEAAAELFPEMLSKLVKSGLSQEHLLEYFRRHAEWIPQIKLLNMKDMAAFSHLDEAFEAFGKIPWSANLKFEFLMASLETYVESPQENHEHFEKLYPHFYDCYDRLGRLGWGERRKFRFLLHSLKASGDYASSAYQAISQFIEFALPLWGAPALSRFLDQIGSGTLRHFGLFDSLKTVMKDWSEKNIAPKEQRKIILELGKRAGEDLDSAVIVLESQGRDLSPENFSRLLELLYARKESKPYYEGLESYLGSLQEVDPDSFQAHLGFLKALSEKFPLGEGMEDLAKARTATPTLLPDRPEDLEKIAPAIQDFIQTTGTFDLSVFTNYRIHRFQEGERHFFVIQDKATADGPDPLEIKISAPFIQNPAYFKWILRYLDLGNRLSLKRRSESEGDFVPIDPGIQLSLLENPQNLAAMHLQVLLYEHHRSLDPNWPEEDPRPLLKAAEKALKDAR